MADLSVLIPARNEEFLSRTIDNIIENMRGDTDIIAVCDGYWPEPVIQDNKKVIIIHFTSPVGQRAATNIAANVSRSKFIMKLDAHCAVDVGFDIKLMQDYEEGWTVIPRMYNLHAFDWQCKECGYRSYQGPIPTKCFTKTCNSKTYDRVMVWQPRKSRMTDFARFDKTLHFQYWNDYKHRETAKGQIVNTLCSVGACFFMSRQRFLDLGGLDEKHGSWGQVGVEVACKAFLSGGRQVVNKNTWFSHMFRTNKGFGFPYHNPESEVEKARQYSRWLWMGGNWDKAIHPLTWLIDKFAPVPDWH